MKFLEAGAKENMEYPFLHVLELTRRNVQTLLDKLDDPLSNRALMDPDAYIVVKAVEDEEHYKDRDPGVVYMPSTGEYR